MARQALTTTQRGLGGDHQKAKERLLRELADGDLCARCASRGVEHPMSRDLITWRGGKPRSSILECDDFPGRVHGGPQVKRLSYAHCNRSAGAKVGNRRRRRRKPATGTPFRSRW